MEPASRSRRMRAPLLVGAGGLLACATVYAIDPAGDSGIYPPCPTKVLTGYDCPLCGSLRATHVLLHGDVGRAIDLNALTVLLFFPVVLGLYGAWAYRRWRGETFELSIPRWVTGAAVIVIVAFTVIRNLPGMPWGTAA